MFIAHLPAGYIASSLLFARHARTGVRRARYLRAGMLGAVAPDIDLLYFYLIDHRRHAHHSYWTHYPLVWGCLILASAAWLGWGHGRMRAAGALALVFALNGMLHLVLDTVVGDIEWLAPFSHESYALFAVPALYKPWWLNFFLHWSFALELCIAAAALVFWRRGLTRPRAPAPP